MLTDIQRDYLAKAVRTMQIIVAALAMGVIMFMAVVLTMLDKIAARDPFITYIALGFAVLMFAGWIIVPGIVATQARRAMAGLPRDADIVGQLAGVFQTRLIIASAMLEGAAFFNLIASMLEGQYVGLVTAVVLLLIIISQFPTRHRLEVWITHELENIDHMRV